ncbi:lanthionine synthetase LanC family protein [Streptomyces sp. NPDC004749]
MRGSSPYRTRNGSLLALAHDRGFHVPGQLEAMSDVCSWLLAHSGRDAWGTYWPSAVSPDEEGAGPCPGPRGEDGWCTGTSGIASALRLAAGTLRVPEWMSVADEALTGALRHHHETRARRDPILCHGTAGLLQIAARAGRTDLVARLLGDLLEMFDPDRPLGFRSPADRVVGPDTEYEQSPGFLIGAVGAALALAHAAGLADDPANGPDWDAALLLS